MTDQGEQQAHQRYDAASRDVTPTNRIRNLNDQPLRPGGSYVLYWMVAARRTRDSFALDRAVELATELNCGLVVLEALRIGYKWSSHRLHSFVIDGMIDNASALEDSPVAYFPYVEPEPDAGKGLLEALSSRACAVVTDDFPCFFVPKMLRATAARLEVKLEAVDGNGLYPMRATDRVFTTAASFRRHLHKVLPPFLAEFPVQDPLRRLGLPKAKIPAAVRKRWPPTKLARISPERLPIDQSVSKARISGGSQAAEEAFRCFLDDRLAVYADGRNQPEADAQSHLSPYLHFGHISAHNVFRKLMEREDWSPERIALKPTGSRNGWWGASAAAEAFVDQLVTWREIGFNRCANDAGYASFSSLPSWALATLEKHADDPRPYRYTAKQFEAAETHDELWNAAQRQLMREGWIHNYLRMLWGKKILEWSSSPKQALRTMLELNNKYALDGRDPNSYSGIFWVLGRYDRAWGPERPIFGKVRYMSSDNTARKIKVKGYLRRYSA